MAGHVGGAQEASEGPTMTDPLTLLSRTGSVSGLSWDEARRLKRRGQARGWISKIVKVSEGVHRVEIVPTPKQEVES